LKHFTEKVSIAILSYDILILLLKKQSMVRIQMLLPDCICSTIIWTSFLVLTFVLF